MTASIPEEARRVKSRIGLEKCILIDEFIVLQCI